MAESTLSLSYPDYMEATGHYLGYGRSGWATPEQNEVDSLVQSGYRQALQPPPIAGGRSHEWSFLRPTLTVETSAPYKTGTVEIVAGVVTLTGGTWPEWAADGSLLVNGQPYDVASRDSDAELSLRSATATASGGSEFSLSRLTVTLPDDFGRFDGPLTFGPLEAYHTIPLVGEAEIRRRRQMVHSGGRPVLAAVRYKPPTGVTGQRQELLLWPNPDAVYHMTGRYHALQNKLTTEAPYPIGGQPFAETVLASCLAVAELRLNDRRGERWDEFMQRLAAAVEWDNMTAPEFLGRNGNPGCQSAPANYRVMRATYNGVQY